MSVCPPLRKLPLLYLPVEVYLCVRLVSASNESLPTGVIKSPTFGVHPGAH